MAMPYRLNGRQTILKHGEESVNAAGDLALCALGWVLSDTVRASRFLDLTGLTPEALRASLSESPTQAAILDFLCAHEPDLVAAAEALGVPPAELARAREALK